MHSLSKLEEASNDVLKEYFYDFKFSSSSNFNYFVCYVKIEKITTGGYYSKESS